MNWTNLLQASLLLFAIVNPIGSIPIFLQLTHPMSREARQRTFQTGVVASFVILMIFALAGHQILTQFFRIEFSDLMAAGGLLLLIIAIDHLVFGALVKSVTSGDVKEAHHLGAVPMACPILAGPGAMMTVVLINSQHGSLIAFAAILVVLVMTWLILHFIDVIYRFLGEIVCLVLSKILSLFLAAIGIHFLMQGLVQYFR
jgi:multiple antibiotic resistance protein